MARVRTNFEILIDGEWRVRGDEFETTQVDLDQYMADTLSWLRNLTPEED